MKSTIFFISMLLFVSCTANKFEGSSIVESDSAFLELAQNPATDAIFATMNMQLTTTDGFNRVLSLLDQLIADGKKQLHQIVKTWRKVSARCAVSKVELAGRQEWFATYKRNAERNQKFSRQQLVDAQAHLAGNKESIRVYSNHLKAELSRHSNQRVALRRKALNAKTAIETLDVAVKAVQNWTPAQQALIQRSMNKVVIAYMQVQSIKITSPVELLETVGSDRKVKNRLLQWLGRLKVTLEGDRQAAVNVLDGREKLWKQVEKNLATLLENLNLENRSLNKAIAFAHQRITEDTKFVTLYSKLVAQNSGLIVANRNYCNNEEKNYTAQKARNTAALAIFEEVKKYFIDNYDQVHSYIRARYNRN